MQVQLLRGAEADLLELYIRAEEIRPGAGDQLYGVIDAPSPTCAIIPSWHRFTGHPTVASSCRHSVSASSIRSKASG